MPAQHASAELPAPGRTGGFGRRHPAVCRASFARLDQMVIRRHRVLTEANGST